MENILLQKENIYAFIKNPKYYDMLKLITENVSCYERVDNILAYYERNDFDAIVIGEDINSYEKPLELIGNVCKLLKKGGTLICSLYNCYDYRNLVSSFIDERWRDKHFYVQMHYKDVIECLNEKNMEFVNVYNEVHSVKKEVYDLIKQINERLGDLESDSNMIYQMLMTERYWFCIRK